MPTWQRQTDTTQCDLHTAWCLRLGQMLSRETTNQCHRRRLVKPSACWTAGLSCLRAPRAAAQYRWGLFERRHRLGSTMATATSTTAWRRRTRAKHASPGRVIARYHRHCQLVAGICRPTGPARCKVHRCAAVLTPRSPTFVRARRPCSVHSVVSLGVRTWAQRAQRAAVESRLS